jgi:hypothetical protein
VIIRRRSLKHENNTVGGSSRSPATNCTIFYAKPRSSAILHSRWWRSGARDVLDCRAELRSTVISQPPFTDPTQRQGSQIVQHPFDVPISTIYRRRTTRTMQRRNLSSAGSEGQIPRQCSRSRPALPWPHPRSKLPQPHTLLGSRSVSDSSGRKQASTRNVDAARNQNYCDPIMRCWPFAEQRDGHECRHGRAQGRKR